MRTCNYLSVRDPEHWIAFNFLFRMTNSMIFYNRNLCRMSLATPLVDGMVVSRRAIGPLLRQTALNMCRYAVQRILTMEVLWKSALLPAFWEGLVRHFSFLAAWTRYVDYYFLFRTKNAFLGTYPSLLQTVLWIRIYIFSGLPDPSLFCTDPDPNLDSTILWFIFVFLSMKNWCNWTFKK